MVYFNIKHMTILVYCTMPWYIMIECFPNSIAVWLLVQSHPVIQTYQGQIIFCHFWIWQTLVSTEFHIVPQFPILTVVNVKCSPYIPVILSFGKTMFIGIKYEWMNKQCPSYKEQHSFTILCMGWGCPSVMTGNRSLCKRGWPYYSQSMGVLSALTGLGVIREISAQIKVGKACYLVPVRWIWEGYSVELSTILCFMAPIVTSVISCGWARLLSPTG